MDFLIFPGVSGLLAFLGLWPLRLQRQQWGTECFPPPSAPTVTSPLTLALLLPLPLLRTL